MKLNKLDSLMCEFLKERSSVELYADFTKIITDSIKNPCELNKVKYLTVELDGNVHRFLIEDRYDFLVKESIRSLFWNITKLARSSASLKLDEVKKELQCENFTSKSLFTLTKI